MSRQQRFGAEAQTSDFSFSTFYATTCPLRSLSTSCQTSQGSWSRQGRTSVPGRWWGSRYVWWGRHFTFPASLLRPGNITDSMHRSGICLPLKIWPQCLGSSLCTVHSYSVLFCFIFKIKQTSSMTWCQNKEAGEHENKNYGPFHPRGESPSLDPS